jgi:hypothetical protein
MVSRKAMGWRCKEPWAKYPKVWLVKEIAEHFQVTEAFVRGRIKHARSMSAPSMATNIAKDKSPISHHLVSFLKNNSSVEYVKQLERRDFEITLASRWADRMG